MLSESAVKTTLLKVDKKYSNGEDIGYVGDVKSKCPDFMGLIGKDFLPVIAPIGMDDNYDTYNINADDLACAIAKAMKSEKLAFLTDVEGVMRDPSDKSSLISELTLSEAEGLIKDGTVGGGMLPKLNNCMDAIREGVSECIFWTEEFTLSVIGNLYKQRYWNSYFR